MPLHQMLRNQRFTKYSTKTMFIFVKNPKKSAIIDHILLEGHNATYDDFSILTTESNEFKLHLKESLLIKRDKPELNRNCYTHPLELFD